MLIGWERNTYVKKLFYWISICLIKLINSALTYRMMSILGIWDHSHQSSKAPTMIQNPETMQYYLQKVDILYSRTKGGEERFETGRQFC